MPVSFVLLAVSRLSPGTGVSAVSAMFARARQQAAAHGVTGMMAFDGAGFCHYIEGEHRAVLACIDHFQSDLRMDTFEVMHHGRCGERRCGDFLSGYAPGDGPPASEVLRALDGHAALETFLALAEGFDLRR